MTTTAPPPEALATAPKAIVISQYEVLLGDIKEAAAAAADVSFNYADPKGNKEARSYIFGIRKLKARIEAARTDAKRYALDYGRKVDSQAADLKDQVDALIRPHQDAIDAIAKAEADRVQRHRDKIHFITDLGRVPFGASAETLAASIETANAIDIDGLEEYREEAAAALWLTIRNLQAAHAKALVDEAAAAELEQLREQQRIQQEKDAEDARIKAQQEAVAEAARKAQEEADAAALLVIEEAEQRVADAEARAAAAEAKAADAEAVADLLQSEALLAITPAEVPQPPATVPAQFTRSGPVPPSAGPMPTEAEATAAVADAEHQLRLQLQEALAGLNRLQVVDALVTGTLHPAVKIDWSLV